MNDSQIHVAHRLVNGTYVHGISTGCSNGCGQGWAIPKGKDIRNCAIKFKNCSRFILLFYFTNILNAILQNSMLQSIQYPIRTAQISHWIDCIVKWLCFLLCYKYQSHFMWKIIRVCYQQKRQQQQQKSSKIAQTVYGIEVSLMANKIFVDITPVCA